MSMLRVGNPVASALLLVAADPDEDDGVNLFSLSLSWSELLVLSGAPFLKFC